jgi:hypothetical protein
LCEETELVNKGREMVKTIEEIGVDAYRNKARADQEKEMQIQARLQDLSGYERSRN